jgi:glucose dehydrogenase
VHDLEVAWVHRTGVVADGREGRPAKASFEATPVLDAGSLYFCSPMNRVFAVDAETGEERWVHDPGIDPTLRWGRICRGVAVWRDAKAAAGGRCARRVFTGTSDARLIALDAADGRPCEDFGDGGQVDLHRGVGEHDPWEYRVTSPPTLVGDVVAVGAMVADNQRLGAPSGVVRGFRSATCCSCPRATPRPISTAVTAGAWTTTPARWWRSAARRVTWPGASRPCTTICGTTTSRRSRRSSTSTSTA